tara:strand:+ start:117 stop:308 length:192 start_codon:yes stop_codon:yes gene_type:complete
MAEFTTAQMAVLVERLDLVLSDDELGWLTRCFNGYQRQLQSLHSLELDEQVSAAFQDPMGLGT